ncbi:hypothetical protein M408DRAFT_11035 [Serendipita vermifera MAFF 305830]|uniref:Uncharacterized protein n=1 Tax=Serendipita vermifera MAFF 305830 TaxID=933852 RepID=A0A0C3AYW4_SERVB|nr:hypothetical protein M408DRAFT_11035 [Serendipita vermifera MAFF 305830]
MSDLRDFRTHDLDPCLKCQKAQWQEHKESGKESLKLPRIANSRKQTIKRSIKHIERWHYIHKKALLVKGRTLMHLSLSNPFFHREASTIRIFMETNDASLNDPPLAWPVKVTVTMTEQGHASTFSSSIQEEMHSGGRSQSPRQADDAVIDIKREIAKYYGSVYATDEEGYWAPDNDNFKLVQYVLVFRVVK